jgi:NhaP-type Na+/H+ or K+/H+ antiporter
VSGGAIVTVAAVVLGYALLSGRLRRTPFTAPLVCTAIGLLVSSDGFGWLDGSVSPHVLHGVTNATLVVVLFADAAQLDPSTLRREVGVPVRLLVIGLPLTIVAGALAARVVLPALAPVEAVILAIILAPTDAALGQAVVVDPRLPTRIRQGLNTESGLNDGICVPLLAVALAVADVTEAGGVTHSVIEELLRGLAYGTLAGIGGGGLTAMLLRAASRRGWIEPLWRPLVAVAGGAIAFGLAERFGGSGFVAAFVGGITFRVVFGPNAPEEV